MAHVEINGVEYRLAEDAEGEHYSLSGEPLRPPNAVTVQGENSQKFQMRPDTLLWTLTDWSGGEGQEKFNIQTPSRWRELDAVRVFDKPGTVTPGWGTAELEDASAVLAADGALVLFGTELYLLDDGSNTIYKFNTGTGKWDAGTTLTGPTGGASRQAAADHSNIYWHESGTDNVWKWNGTTTTQIDNGEMANFSDALVSELGGYVYVYSPAAGQVWEIPKAGTPDDVLIDDFSDDPSSAITGDAGIVSMDGKIYIVTNKLFYSTIREIVPTTAAGAGFGAEIARFPGVTAHAMWAHAGLLYLGGRYGGTNQGAVFYLTPGGEYGSLGKVRAATQNLAFTAGQQNGDMLQHYFVVASDNIHKVHQVDAITGNMATVARLGAGPTADQAVLFGTHGFFWGTEAITTERTYRADPTKYAINSYTISAWHDFDLANEKILSSLVLSTESLPTNWTVNVDYAIDGTDSWTTAITYTTAGGKGTKAQVSTDAATIKFRTLSIRLRMTYTGTGVPTSGPVILGIDVLAMVAKPTKVWRLLLDLSDGRSVAGGESGHRKRTNIEQAAASEAVVAFKDSYASSTPGTTTEFDVIVDQYAIVLSTPGEGVALVTLKEVA